MISQTNFYIQNKEEIASVLVLAFGLAFGLVFGLVYGLASGLASGLVYGLVYGLAFGLVFGLASGLVFGLASGLTFGLAVILTNFSEALPFINGIVPIIILIGLVIGFTELLFWLMKKEKVDKNKIFWHTVKRKGECFIEVILGLSGITQIYILIREGIKYITEEVISEILKLIGYIGTGILILLAIIGLLYLWIKLNERKYTNG